MPVQLLHAVAVIVKQSWHVANAVNVPAFRSSSQARSPLLQQQRPGMEASSGLPLTEGVSLREDRIGLMSSLLASQPNELMRNGQSHGNKIILRFGAPPWSVVIGVLEDGNMDMRVMAGGIDLLEMDGSKQTN
ncbi:hypothetical protein EDD17DRAFT_1512286 [Pisolithus thermaeus]|nr:hypothetical protein EDD17DRAFT_1512286 [Pisolithus thermaeus]